MITHIKPTAEKDAVFRFKSNFIRFFRDLEKDTGHSVLADLCDGVPCVGDGIAETGSNIAHEIHLIREKHSKTAMAEIRAMLRRAAAELDIPLP